MRDWRDRQVGPEPGSSRPDVARSTLTWSNSTHYIVVSYSGPSPRRPSTHCDIFHTEPGFPVLRKPADGCVTAGLPYCHCVVSAGPARSILGPPAHRALLYTSLILYTYYTHKNIQQTKNTQYRSKEFEK